MHVQMPNGLAFLQRSLTPIYEKINTLPERLSNGVLLVELDVVNDSSYAACVTMTLFILPIKRHSEPNPNDTRSRAF